MATTNIGKSSSPWVCLLLDLATDAAYFASGVLGFGLHTVPTHDMAFPAHADGQSQTATDPGRHRVRGLVGHGLNTQMFNPRTPELKMRTATQNQNLGRRIGSFLKRIQ